MLGLQRKKRTRDNVKEKSQHTCQDWLQESQKYIKDKAELEVTYSPLSSKRKVRGCLSLAALCPAGRGSICRWPWSSRFGLTCKVKLGRTLLTQHRNIRHFNFLLPTRRIITGVPMAPSFLLIPLKDSKPTLFPSIC